MRAIPGSCARCPGRTGGSPGRRADRPDGPGRSSLGAHCALKRWRHGAARALTGRGERSSLGAGGSHRLGPSASEPPLPQAGERRSHRLGPSAPSASGRRAADPPLRAPAPSPPVCPSTPAWPSRPRSPAASASAASASAASACALPSSSTPVRQSKRLRSPLLVPLRRVRWSGRPTGPPASPDRGRLAPDGAQRPQSAIRASTSRPTCRPGSNFRTLRRRRMTS